MNDFFFNVCPHCRYDIEEMILSDGILEPGEYRIECPNCGHEFSLVFTYSIMTYETPTPVGVL